MTPAPIPAAGDFMTCREARSLLGLTPDQLQRLMRRGTITVRRIPGTTPRLLRADVERIARESITPAIGGA